MNDIPRGGVQCATFDKTAREVRRAKKLGKHDYGDVLPQPWLPKTDEIPDWLRESPPWMCWAFEWDDGDELTKVPRSAYGGDYRVSATNPKNWADFETALQTARRGGWGIGLVFDGGTDVVGTDIDDGRNPSTGRPTDEAKDIIHRLDTWTEISVSATGYHPIARGELPDGGNRRGDLEMYDNDRFFAITGQHVEGTPETVEDRRSAVEAIHREYIADDEPEPPDGNTIEASASASVGEIPDAELIERAENAKNGAKFSSLWRGDTSGYDSHSEGRQALANLLAFWTGGDERRMLRLFQSSDLYRDKDDHRTLENYEMPTALEGRTEFYDPASRPAPTSASDGGTATGLTTETVRADGDDADTSIERFARTAVEPLVDENDRIHLAQATEDGQQVNTVPFGRFRCQQCGTVVDNAVIRGEGIEVPDECFACERNGPFDPVGPLGESDPDLSLSTYLDPPWYAPSAVEPDRLDELWSDTREFIRDHWDAGVDYEYLYDGLTAYAITTWLRPDLEFLPHLMLMGRFTGGKTRLLNTLARVSYRAIVSASATPASMFRLIDSHDVTFFVSEYHGLDPDTRRDLDAIIRAAQKRGEKVTRSEANPDTGGFDVGVFDPFTHVGVATQYEPKDDIISRCVQVRSSPADRDMPATFDEDRGRDIRN